MARDLISNLSEWGLVYDEQDVRGRDVYSTDGSKLGEVKDMVADTEAAQIVALVLDNGQEYSADLVEIEEDRVVIHTTDTLSSSRDSGRTPKLYSDTERGLRQGGRGDAGLTDSVHTYDDKTGTSGAGSMGAALGGMTAGGSSTSDYGSDRGSVRDQADSDLHDRGILGSGDDDRLRSANDVGEGRPISGGTSGSGSFGTGTSDYGTSGSGTSDYGSSGSGSTAGAVGSGTGSATGMGGSSSGLGSSMGGSDLGSSDDAGMLRASGGGLGTTSMGGGSMGTSGSYGTSGGYDYDAVTIGDEDSRHFREHHQSTYGSTGSDYSKMEPSYKYGYAYGRRYDYKDRDYDASESDLRRDYESRGSSDGAWDDVKDAVKGGFQRARNAVTGGDDGNRSTSR